MIHVVRYVIYIIQCIIKHITQHMLTAHSFGDLAKEYDVAEGQVKKVPMAGHELVGF